MGSRLKVAAVVSVAALLAGCEGSTVQSVKDLGTDQTLITSTDVRVVNRMRPQAYGAGQVIPATVTCVEPSPDVAKAVSESFNLGGGLSAPNVPVEVALALAYARSEGIAQLTQRLATIQLLRDGLYRACEAYTNGAISSTTYAVMLGRFDDAMVTMLMGELAAGNFGGRLAAIGTGAGGNANGQAISAYQELIKQVEPPAAADGVPSESETAGTTAERSQERSVNVQAIAAGLAETSKLLAAESRGFRQNPEVARVIGTMQRKYIENINFDAMVVACINALDSGRVTDQAKLKSAYDKLAAANANDGDDAAATLVAAKTEYDAAIADHTNLSPLGWHCLQNVLPRIADHGARVLNAILERSAKEKQPEEAAAQLEGYADAIFDLRKSIKIDELDLAKTDDQFNALTEAVSTAATASKGAADRVRAQQLVVQTAYDDAIKKDRALFLAQVAANEAAAAAERLEAQVAAATKKHTAADERATELEEAARATGADQATKDAAAATRQEATDAQAELDKVNGLLGTAKTNQSNAETALSTAREEATAANSGLEKQQKTLQTLFDELDSANAALDDARADFGAFQR